MHGRLADRSSMVAVAQLVESRIVIPVVVGSSPISHPIRSKSYSFTDLCAVTDLCQLRHDNVDHPGRLPKLVIAPVQA